MRVALLLCVALALPAWSEDEPVDAPTVLITAFRPFAGRQVNGSQTVVEHLRTAVPGVRLEVLLLDVAWSAPGSTLPARVAELKPRLLIGLGEGHPGRVCVERVARNQRVGADVTGQPPAERAVDAAGPAQRQGTLRFDPAWDLGRGIPVTTSDDAGTYLCNALFYTALGLPVERVGFIHLPPQGDEDGAAYAGRLAPIVRELIRRNL
jgi:pyroglutamyl-peptidase